MADKLSPLLEQLATVLAVGGKGLQGAAVGGLRVLLPLIEAYTGQRVDGVEGGGEAGALGFKRGEEAVLKAGAQKAFLELVEITSRTHPLYPGAPAFAAFDAQGAAQKPQLVHLLALATAARQTFGDGDGDGKGDGDEQPDPIELPPTQQSVVFMAVGPGEYALRSGPMTAREIRRMSMRQRSYTPPQAARLQSAPNARSLQVGAAVQAAAASRSAQKAAGALALRGNGCGCGGAGGCARCGGGGVRRFAPARYDKDGECMSIGTVSCDTRWRVRECLKVAFCDLLRCVGEQLCDENGRVITTPKPDWKACLETFVCSVVTCLPDAICPPPEPAACAAPLTCIEPSDDCNFAVGE